MMRHDRAGGSDASDGSRVKPPAVFLDLDFKPNKEIEPISTQDFAKSLRDEGFRDGDSPAALFLFKRVSHEHMRRYLELASSPRSVLPKTVQSANALMTFDRQFQMLVLEFIGLFELQFRSRYAEEMSSRYGAFAHRNKRLFKDPAHYRRFLSEYATPCNKIMRGRDSAQKRHIEEYGDMPIWEAVEELSLGTISKLYRNTKSRAVREAVAASFGVEIDVLQSWLSTLTVVRNECAHFGMLLGRQLARQPKAMPEIEADNRKPFYVILMLLRLLRTNTTFGDLTLMYSAMLALKTTQLVYEHPHVALTLEIPENWRDLIGSPDVSGVKMNIRNQYDPPFDNGAPAKSILEPKYD